MSQLGGIRIEDTIVIFPGRFQPFHKGHHDVYRYLKESFPNVFITTTNTKSKKEPERYPFNFQEKKRIMIELGNIDPLDIVPTATRFPYSDAETLSYIKKMQNSVDPEISRRFQNIDLNSATIIYVISKKDINRFKFPNEGLSLKRNQTPAKIQKLRFRNNINSNNDYLPKYNNINIDQVFDSYNYVLTMPTFPFNILGNTLRGATGFREMMSNPPSGYTVEDVVEDLYEIQGEKTAEQEELLNLIKERLI
jgi:cytidyltransferase-like protein